MVVLVWFGPANFPLFSPVDRLVAQELEESPEIRAAQRHLEIQERTFGSEHAEVATSLGAVAMLYYGAGQYRKAEPLLERAWRIRENALGPDHPDTAQFRNNLAALYHAKGDFAKAEPLLERGLRIREKVLARLSGFAPS